MAFLPKRASHILILVVLSVIAGLVVSLGLLWGTFDTEYSVGFSKPMWSKAEVGMPESEAKSLLGEPLDEAPWTNLEKKTLYYSRSRSGNGNYLCYYLVVRSGTIVEEHRDVFWD